MAASPNDPTLLAQRCFAALAACLLERRESITKTWLDGVLHHPGIPSAHSLTRQQLIDHLPNLFDDMAAAVRAANQDELSIQPTILADAKEHGRHRWEQGYRLDELLRELSIIRSLIMREALDRFVAQNEEYRQHVDMDRARDVIIRFFEETNIGSVEQYIHEQQAQLEMLNDELSRVDLARLRLIGTIAHELGNSVYSLEMVTEVLSRSTDNDASERERALALTEGAFREIQTFLTQLTDYAALSAPPVVILEPVDLRSLGSDTEGTFQSAAMKAGSELQTFVDERLLTVQSERAKLRRIVTNLVTNAIKFRRADRLEGRIVLSMVPEGDDFWSLTVEDDGVGIAPSDRERVFEEFARVPNTIETPGAGLGLSITRRLVELLGGTIQVEESCTGGCLFKARFPLDPGNQSTTGAV